MQSSEINTCHDHNFWWLCLNRIHNMSNELCDHYRFYCIVSISLSFLTWMNWTVKKNLKVLYLNLMAQGSSFMATGEMVRNLKQKPCTPNRMKRKPSQFKVVQHDSTNQRDSDRFESFKIIKFHLKFYWKTSLWEVTFRVLLMAYFLLPLPIFLYTCIKIPPAKIIAIISYIWVATFPMSIISSLSARKKLNFIELNTSHIRSYFAIIQTFEFNYFIANDLCEPI